MTAKGAAAVIDVLVTVKGAAAVQGSYPEGVRGAGRA